MAHALVMRVDLPAQEDAEEAVRMLNDIVIPAAKAQPGFQRGIWMRDGQNGLGIVVFDTADQADAAGETLKPPPGGPTLLSSTTYEVGAEA